MKQRMLIVIVLIFLVLLLVGLNAATYVQREKVPDTELAPNRSTYNYGTTGSHAFYTLLSETGRSVRRWQEPLDTISSTFTESPSVFVMIGPFRRQPTDVEIRQLMEWVTAGGTLVIIDREPSSQLALTTAQWQMSVVPNQSSDLMTIDSTDQNQMTAQTPALKPSLPSFFTHGVTSVQPSRFASTIGIERFREVARTAEAEDSGTSYRQPPPPPPAARVSPTPFDFYGQTEVAPTPLASSEEDPEEDTSAPGETDVQGPTAATASSLSAPVIHVGDAKRSIVVEAPFADGRVVILSDPYIVSNAGLSLVDNSRLAINLVTSRSGLIAFDEYHHGHGANNNRFLEYFEGTPVMTIFAQIALMVVLVFFSQSRRFARPVPEPEPNRLSKLEYVSAMAELQQRTRAYDLAIENIYSDFRRRASALLGLDNTTATRKELAERMAERLGRHARQIEDVLFRCEDIIHGEPTGKKDTIELVEQLRGLEEALGLKRSRRKGV